MAIIDSRASGEFILSDFVKRIGIATRTKLDKGYELILANGSFLLNVDDETVPLSLVLQQHHEKLALDIMLQARHDIVLSNSWL